MSRWATLVTQYLANGIKCFKDRKASCDSGVNVSMKKASQLATRNSLTISSSDRQARRPGCREASRLYLRLYLRLYRRRCQRHCRPPTTLARPTRCRSPDRS
eukprot:362875-Chlamydomonas_euryale.AAC.1